MSLGLTWEASGAGFFVPNPAGGHRPSRSGLISGENMGSIPKSEEAPVPIRAGFLAGKPLAGTSAHGRTVSRSLAAAAFPEGWTRKLVIDGSETGQTRSCPERNTGKQSHFPLVSKELFFLLFLFLSFF